MDSIPAVLAITLNAFIVYTSNVFAILGLRSMYFALAGVMDLFHYLHYGLSVVLIFIGLKMLGSHYVQIPTEWALAIGACRVRNFDCRLAGESAEETTRVYRRFAPRP